ncbi:MAG: metal ABC transporter substrate-binding protein [Candidatus Eisenbacteria bacterium]
MSRIALISAIAALALAVGPASAKVRVAASTNDLASIASRIGGEQVEVFAIARASSDPHRVETLPSYMVKVSRARVYLKVGLGLDQWADAIIDGSRNNKVLLVDCSKGVTVLERPTGRVDASMGDVHPDGNPHYWLDPRNGAVIGQNIAEALARVDPAHAELYRANAESFSKEAAASYETNRIRAAQLGSKSVITYHRSWSYLANAFGLEVVATVEPVPGIPPTAKHLALLVQTAKARKVRVLLQEPYFSAEAGRFLMRQAGVRAVTQSSACDGITAGSYLAHFETLFTALAGGAAK